MDFMYPQRGLFQHWVCYFYPFSFFFPSSFTMEFPLISSCSYPHAVLHALNLYVKMNTILLFYTIFLYDDFIYSVNNSNMILS